MRAITTAVCTAILFLECGSAQPADPQPSVSNPAARLGVMPYQAKKWGIVGVRLINPTDRDVRILVSSSIGNAKTNQYGREFWIPARSRRTSWHSIFTPEAKSESARSLAIDSIVTERSDGNERILKTATGAIAHDGLLPYSRNKSPTAVIVDFPETQSEGRLDTELEPALTAVDACQFASQHRRATLEMSRGMLPPVTTAWEGVRHVVLIGDRLADDMAAITAVRRWLMRGGRIWIMLDRVKQDTVERLLGDGCPYREVDRVGLTTVRVQPAEGSFREANRETKEYEQPVPLVRTLVTEATVTHTINGWPAAFQQEYGRGKIIYTTLGMRAWIRRTTPQDQEFSDAIISHMPNETLSDLMGDFYSFQQPGLLKPKLFDEYLSQQIGYQVVERKTILLVLTAFCASLVLAGVWLVRVRRFNLLVGVGPLFAVIAAGLLVAAGMRSLHSVPNTVATLQFVEVTPESDDVNVTGLLTIYRQEESREPLTLSSGGIVSPNLASQPGATRRMVWSDIDSWRWENASVPAGVNRSTIQYSRNIGKPIAAVGSFGPDGLSGTLETGPFKEPGDAVFATASLHQLAVKIKDDGSFVAGSQEMLTRSEHIRSVLLTDEQRRRQGVYRKLLPNDVRNKQIDKPMMFVWTKPIETGFTVSADEESRGSALLAIPLRLKRTPPGSRVSIPGTFLPIRGFRGPPGYESSGQYNNADGTWLERARPARTWLRVKLPPEVLPLRMQRLTVTLQITGKDQPVKIFEMVEGKPRVLASRENPVGIQRIEIDATNSLPIDPSGVVTFGIFVGDTASLDQLKPKAVSGEKWKIDFLHVEVSGTTLEKTPKR